MGILARIVGAIGGGGVGSDPAPSRRRSVAGRVKARYDAAADTVENRKHWANADGLSADAAQSPSVRRTLRMRSRYEAANNSYAKGIIDTLANDIVGIGPQLQVDGDGAEDIERLWASWSRDAHLNDTLRVMIRSAAESGECFARFVSGASNSGRVKLGLRLIEADQVASPGMMSDLSASDGIEFDSLGNPESYSVLRAHPGANYAGSTEADKIAAAEIVHYFRRDRPGQVRGLPWLMPALPLFAQLRRFTLATLTAAETAASIALAISTDAIADQGDGEDPETLDTFEMERGLVTVLPPGYKLGQVDPAQPSATYEMFKREILNEAARAVNMPFNIAAGNSSSYNYASGRLDHQTYDLSNRVIRDDVETVVLERIFSEFWREAVLLGVGSGEMPSHSWLWQSRAHVDPTKEASAQADRLASMTTTLRRECSMSGDDWRDVLRQIAEEEKELKRLGLTRPVAAPAPATMPTDRGNSDG